MPKKNKSNNDRRAYWRKHVRKWQESGLSQAEYCRQTQISAMNLSRWKVLFEREQAQEVPTPEIVAVPMPVQDEPAASFIPIVIRRPGGFQVEIQGNFQEAVLGKILRTLDRLP